MIPVLARASLREGLRHPWQILLAVLGIALGVAVVTAIDLTKASARRSFADATEAVMGRATHQIVGGPRGLDERVYVDLRHAGVVPQAAPTIEGNLSLIDYPETSLRLLGVDPIVEAPLRGYWPEVGSQSNQVTQLITKPETVLVSQATATRLDLQAGDLLRVSRAGRLATLDVIGILDPEGEHSALTGTELAVADIATAQEMLDMLGRLSRIDLILGSQTQAEQVQELLPAEAELIASATRTESVMNMTEAFHTNLTALSLLALLVGLFLIYNSQTFLVIQRRRQFGILRALGVRRRQLAVLVLSEAIVLGLVGTTAGLALGMSLAQGLMGLVTQTINDLYYTVSAEGITLAPMSLVKGVLLGIGGSVVAATIPAQEATRTTPRAAISRAELERRVGGAVGLAMRVGLAVVALGAAVFLLPSKAVVLGLTGLFLVVMGFALMSPALTVALSQALQGMSIAQRRIPLRLALRGVTASLSRTGVAVAALMLAVSHVIGVGIMVTSFRDSVSNWLETVLRADYYISAPTSGAVGSGSVLETALVPAIARIPGVKHTSHVRYAKVISPEGIDRIAVYQLNDAARQGFRFRANPEPETFWQRFETQDVVMVSEPYAFHQGLKPGAQISLRTDSGYRNFVVGAIYQDYASDRGTIAMSRTTYDRYWDDPGISGIGVYAGPDFDMEVLQQRLVAILGPE
jgi:putative ABC transport system permease protein